MDLAIIWRIEPLTDPELWVHIFPKCNNAVNVAMVQVKNRVKASHIVGALVTPSEALRVVTFVFAHHMSVGSKIEVDLNMAKFVGVQGEKCAYSVMRLFDGSYARCVRQH